MRSAGTFTSVPGKGGIAMGIVGAIAAMLAARVPTPLGMLSIWVFAAPFAAVLGGAFMVDKARRREAVLSGIVARRFFAGVAPPILVAGMLTWMLLAEGTTNILPAMWLMLYGAGAISGGAFSVRPVILMGICFMILGVACAVTPAGLANVWLGVGFGGLHLLFGAIIAKQYGG